MSLRGVMAGRKRALILLGGITLLALILRVWHLETAVHFMVDELNFALGLLRFDVSYARIDTSANEREQADLQLSWQRQLNADWSLSAGYRHRLSRDTSTDARSNAVFVTVGRDFSVRF